MNCDLKIRYQKLSFEMFISWPFFANIIQRQRILAVRIRWANNRIIYLFVNRNRTTSAVPLKVRAYE